MPHFFISYRTSDQEGNWLAHTVFRELKRQYGEASVFFAIDSKSPGLSFPVKVEQALRVTDVVLVIIGPDWLRILKERQDDPRDWVRFEIAESLKRSGLPVVPVCRAGVEFPGAHELPECLQDLGLRDGVTLDPFQDFESHLARLLSVLERMLEMGRQEREALRLARAKLTALLKWRADDLARQAAAQAEADTRAAAARLAQLEREKDALARRENAARRAALEQEIEATAEAVRAKKTGPQPFKAQPEPTASRAARSILPFPRRNPPSVVPQTQQTEVTAESDVAATSPPSSGYYYQSSGKWTVKGIVTAIAVGALASLPLALLYSYLLRLLPFMMLPPILTIAFGFCNGMVAGALLEWQKVRSLRAGGWAGVVIGVVAMYESWVVWVHAYLKATAQPGSGLFEILLAPTRLWQVVDRIGQLGAWSIFGYRPNGSAIWALWLCELLCVAGLSSLAYCVYEGNPFCETCDTWCTASHTRKLEYCDPAQVDRLLEARDVGCLVKLGPPLAGARKWIELKIRACPKCGATNVVSATAQAQTVGTDNKTRTTSSRITADLLITAAERETLLERLQA